MLKGKHGNKRDNDVKTGPSCCWSYSSIWQLLLELLIYLAGVNMAISGTKALKLGPVAAGVTRLIWQTQQLPPTTARNETKTVGINMQAPSITPTTAQNEATTAGMDMQASEDILCRRKFPEADMMSQIFDRKSLISYELKTS
ncbi:hypothetical protein OS493_014342 [Desmophyllum pertusum]|uniref:Uncharacterized protein n=1 Tax=Desmophyllum pertusum TaxID=174260 RepID=A0A9W9Z4J8_9CNID|nr:hypothetical protein OS493_014342 [Desmophyllum pertusum]